MKFALPILLLALVSATGCGSSGSSPNATSSQNAPLPSNPGPFPPGGPHDDGLTQISPSCAELATRDLEGEYRLLPRDRSGRPEASRVITLSRRDAWTYLLPKPGFLILRPGYVVARLESFRGVCAIRWYNPRTRDSEYNMVLGVRANGAIVLGGDNPEREAYPIVELKPRSRAFR
jgi:hypothetical protein